MAENQLIMFGELTEIQIDSLLRSQCIGRLGCHAGGKTYVVPITYLFDGENLISHTSEGMKIEMMRENPNVCFEIDCIENMGNWESAIIWGVYEELQGYDARLAMQKLITSFKLLLTPDKNNPTHGIEEHQLESGGSKSIVYQIKIVEKTGRFEKH